MSQPLTADARAYGPAGDGTTDDLPAPEDLAIAVAPWRPVTGNDFTGTASAARR